MTRNVSDYFNNKIVLITGGASGIGSALAQQLAAHGSTVIIADRDFPAAEKIGILVNNNGGQAHAFALDVRDRHAFAQLAADVRERFGRIDMLFNNAGIAIGGPAYEYGAQEWDDVIDVNLKGVIHGVDAVYPLMRAQGFGQIVNTASIVALFPNALTISYSASKAAVNALSMTLRIEARAFGIKVNALCPGPITTPILYGGKFGRRGHGISQSAMERYWQKMKPMPADEFARQALLNIAQDRATIVLPRRWNWAAWSYRLYRPLWVNYSSKAVAKLARIPKIKPSKPAS